MSPELTPLVRSAAEALSVALVLYLGLGVAFAVAFHRNGLARIDPSAARGTRGFKILITPGVIGLWPLLARRWRRGGAAVPEDAHRRAAAGGS